MKIAITAKGSNWEAIVDPRFGRAETFIIIDTETEQFEVIEHSGLNTMHGAGIQTAQLMSEKNVKQVITGSVGPNAFQTLQAAGIKMYHAKGATVKEVFDAYKTDQLTEITQMGSAHAGIGQMGNRK